MPVDLPQEARCALDCLLDQEELPDELADDRLERVLQAGEKSAHRTAPGKKDGILVNCANAKAVPDG